MNIEAIEAEGGDAVSGGFTVSRDIDGSLKTIHHQVIRRRMKQPSKAELRRQLAVAHARIAWLESPWWVRALAWLRARWPL